MLFLKYLHIYLRAGVIIVTEKLSWLSKRKNIQSKLKKTFNLHVNLEISIKFISKTSSTLDKQTYFALY